MATNLKKMSPLLIYFIFSLFFMESIFRFLTTDQLFSYGMLISFIFSVPAAIIFFLICSFFQGRVSYILAAIFMSFSALIFSSQLLYHDFTGRFYNVFSALSATQIFKEFWSYIIYIMAEHSATLLIMFIPVIFLLTFGKRFFSFEKLNGFNRTILAVSIVLIHLTGIAAIYGGGTGQHSAYELYFNRNLSYLSMERLGLITTMRIDFQRNALGLPGGSDETPPPPAAVSTKEKNNEEKNKHNLMDINFEKLIAGESNEELKDIHQYFKNVQPTSKNEYTGLYEGYNLIFITAESFAPYAVHRDLTPTLYKMIHEGYRFTEFYTPLWKNSTLDGEYTTCTGLLPKSGVWSLYEASDNYLPFTLGNQLKEEGYNTVAYHNHDYDYYNRDQSHPNMGYDYKGIGNGLEVEEIWPASDLEMFKETIPEYINEEPFHAYYMTISGHLPYSFSENNMARKNRKHVENLPYSEEGKAYIASQIELDRAMKYLLDKLEEKGIKDETLIVLTSDHYPYGLKDETIEELSGQEIESNFDLYKNNLILYTGGMKPKTIDEPASNLDILPTVSNLLGLNYDSRLLMGRDIFSDSEPLVTFLDRSFITDKGKYNSVSKEFEPAPGKKVEDNYTERILNKIDNKFYYSARILETDYYRKVLKENTTD